MNNPGPGYLVKRKKDLPKVFYFDSYVTPMVGIQDTPALTTYRVKIPKNILVEQAFHKKATEMIWVIEGSGFALLGDEKVKISKGDVLLIHPLTPHGFVGGSKGVTLLTALSGHVDSKTDFFWRNGAAPHAPPKVLSGKWVQGDGKLK